jgi:hypothetical protein
MIEECIYYLAAKTKSYGARRLGYVYEAAALQSKHRRFRTEWRPHINATRQALLAASADINIRGSVLIVGGGITEDLPITELLAGFECIILVDIVFTSEARCLARRWPGRVVCCYYDVTGVIDWVAKYRCLPRADQRIAFHLPDDDMPPICWVASINCLTQLPILPVRWLHQFGINDHDLEMFFRALIQDHLSWLMDWQVQVCLITEVEEQHFDQNGSLIDSINHRPLLSAFQEQAACLSSWNWNLHPPGALSKHYSETRTVEAWSHLATGNSR